MFPTKGPDLVPSGLEWSSQKITLLLNDFSHLVENLNINYNVVTRTIVLAKV